jgi:hypothetical protein
MATFITTAVRTSTLTYCMVCVGNAMGSHGFCCKEMTGDCLVSVACYLIQRLFALLIALNIRLFLMETWLLRVDPASGSAVHGTRSFYIYLNIRNTEKCME